MADLDNKLRQIVDDIQDYCAKPERYAEPMKEGEQTFVEQIKSAFGNANYYQIMPDDTWFTIADPFNGSRYFLTGQEWYDKLEKATTSLPHDYFGRISREQALSAAKKAAGIE